MTKELFEHVRAGKAKELKEYLDANPKVVVDTPGPDGGTALHLAVAAGNTAIAAELIARTALVNGANKAGDTPLHLAVQAGNLAMCRFLLMQRSLTLAPTNGKGQTPFDIAKETGAKAIAELLQGQIAVQEIAKAASGGLAKLKLVIEATAKEIPLKTLVNLKDMQGESVLHLVAKKHLGVGKRDTGGDMLAYLVDQGASIDEKNSLGQTPLFGATLKCNLGMMQKLIDKGAKLDLADDRGWTVLDQAAAMGALDPEAENLLLKAGAKGTEVTLGDDDPRDTISILLAATLTDQTTAKGQKEAKEKMRGMLEELYRNTKFRAVLDLAAIDAVGPRSKDKKAMRIYLSSGENTASVNGDTQGRGSYTGDKDDKATNNLSIALERPLTDITGTLVHELTHHAAFMVYENKGKPYPPGDKKAEQAYIDAFGNCARNTHLAIGEGEQNVLERIVTRVSGYAKDKDEMLAEFIAGVPQAVYLYGEDMVDGLAHTGLADFDRLLVAAEKHRAKQKLKLDNKKLIEKVDKLGPITPAVGGSQVLDKAGLTPDALAKLVSKQLIAADGKLKTGAKALPFACKIDDFEPTDPTAHERKVAMLTKALASSFDPTALPPNISADMVRDLIDKTETLVNAAGSDSELKKSLAKTTATWTRQAKLDYFDRKMDTTEELGDRELAEATVMAAEEKTWKEVGTTVDDLEVSARKHRKMVDALTSELTNMEAGKKQRIKQSAKTFVAKQADAMSGTQANGFYKQGKKTFGKPNPDKVKIDVAQAKRTWIANLVGI